MTTLRTDARSCVSPWLIQDITGELSSRQKIAIALLLFIALFLFIGSILQVLDPAAGILDIGILSVAVFGGLIGLAAVYCSIWLQELLWQPFRAFRKQFSSHFNQLTSWQQCMLYFSVFFLLLYAALWALAMVL